MKLKIKKANKFYLVENDSTQQESATEQSVSDIFTIKDTDSEFLQNFKEYCKSAINNAEQQPSENKPENASTTSENIPSKESQEKIDKSAEELKKTAAGIAAEEIV